MRAWQTWAAFLVILYLAAVSATWGRTLISTEVWALYYAQQPFSRHMQAVREDLVHPPLMYLLHRLWISIAGSGDSAVKLLPLIINIPALALFTLLAKKATKYWRAASLLFCFVYLAVRVPSTTRMYGLGLLLAITAMLLWNRWREYPSVGRLLHWSLAMTLLVYTHFFGMLLLAGFVVAVLFAGPRRRAFVTAAAAIGLAWVPWLLYVLPVYRERGVETNLGWVAMSLSNPMVSLLQVSASLLGGLDQSRWQLLLALAIHVAIILTALRYGWKFRSAGPGRWIGPMLALTGVPVVLLFVFSLARTPALHIRFLLGILPAYWLLISTFAEAGGRPGRILLFAVILPWSAIKTRMDLKDAIEPSGIHLAAGRLGRAAGDADLIVCAGECNAFYWEWVHRVGGKAEVRRVAAGPKPKELLLRRQREQERRLSILPETPTAELKPEARHVWVVSPAESVSETMAHTLKTLGYQQDSSSRHGSMLVTRFRLQDL